MNKNHFVRFGLLLGMLSLALPGISDELNVYKRTLKITTSYDFQDVEIEWPLISDSENTEVIDKINDDLFSWFTDISTGNPDESPAQNAKPNTAYIKIPTPYGEFTNDEGKKDFFKLGFTQKVDCDVTLNSDTLISFQKVHYWFLGGAHGMTVFTYMLYDLETGNKLKLDDLLLEGYEKILEKKINEKISRENLFDPDKPVKFSDSSEWFVTKDALVIHYPLYAIAPYAAGVYNVEIPFSEMKELIDSKGPLGKL